MGNNVTKFENHASLPAAFDGVFDTEDNDALSSGISGGFPTLSIKGSKFHIKYSGETTLVSNEDGDPKMSLEVVIVKGSEYVSKTYYEGAYVSDSADAPDCFSLDGITPDSAAPKPQNPNCGGCPKAKFGSKISDAGVKSKACADTRRIAVVPLGDLENERYGGPMLLRVPAMSLGDLASYGKAMKEKGFPYATVGTRLSFDPEASYPKLMFKAVRPLNDEEAQVIVEYIRSGDVDSMLNDAREITAATAGAVAGIEDTPPPPPKPQPPKAVDTAFDTEDAPPTVDKKPAAAKKKTKKKAAKKPEPPVVVKEDDTGSEGDDALTSELDSIFKDMED